VFNKYDNNCKTAIQSTILDFYREAEIMSAKQVILQNVDNSLICDTASPIAKKPYRESIEKL